MPFFRGDKSQFISLDDWQARVDWMKKGTRKDEIKAQLTHKNPISASIFHVFAIPGLSVNIH